MNTQSSIGFRQLFDHETWTFTYLLWDLETSEGVIIDPVRENFERDFCLVGELGLHMVYALDTHVHADHITSLGMLQEKFGLQTAVGEPSGVPCADIMLNDGDTLRFGKHDLSALATPGHTNSCTSFKVENMVFTGDTLFIRGCGRTDFQQGDPVILYQSITQKLYTLPDETLVYPGHDYNGKSVSTIIEEKQHNRRIPATQTEADFAKLMNSLNLPMPKRINEAVPANMACGFSADQGHLTEEVFGVNDLQKILDSLTEDEMVIDCRTPNEYEGGHIPGAINIPMGKELDHFDELGVYSKIYLYCKSGRRSQSVYTCLLSKGLKNMVCLGSSGLDDWIKCGFQIERSSNKSTIKEK